MKKIQMRGGNARRNAARHSETSFQQRPIKTFPIECDEHAALGQPFIQRQQQRMFLAKIAHEKLLDLQAAGIPPREADEKRIRAGAADESGGFRIQKKPLRGIGGQCRIARRAALLRSFVFAQPRFQKVVALTLACARASSGCKHCSGVAYQRRITRCSPNRLR